MRGLSRVAGTGVYNEALPACLLKGVAMDVQVPFT